MNRYRQGLVGVLVAVLAAVPGMGRAQEAASAEGRSVVPVAMAKKGARLPKWWNLHEPGMYVGVSLPDLNGERAKQAAIANAVYSFVRATGGEVKYKAENSSEIREPEAQDSFKATCLGSDRGFAIRLLKEYYNPKGEYFVLCEIDKEAEATGAMKFVWTFSDTNAKGSLALNLALLAELDNNVPVKSMMQYEVSWDGEEGKYNLSFNGDTLARDKEIKAGKDNIADFTIGGDLGLAQLRLLTAIPMLPDSIVYTSRMVSSPEITDFTSNVFGEGELIPTDIKWISYGPKGLTFSVTEQFPELEYRANPDAERIAQGNGLSEKYSREYVDAAGEPTVWEEIGNSASGLFEAAKNTALLNAIGMSCMRRPATGSLTEEKSRWIVEPVSATHIYPLYYLDSAERREYKKKEGRKVREAARKAYPRMITVITPIYPAEKADL